VRIDQKEEGMKIHTRWALLLAACGCAAIASRLWRRRHGEIQAQKAELHDWENEGGQLAASQSSPPSNQTLY